MFAFMVLWKATKTKCFKEKLRFTSQMGIPLQTGLGYAKHTPLTMKKLKFSAGSWAILVVKYLNKALGMAFRDLTFRSYKIKHSLICK